MLPAEIFNLPSGLGDDLGLVGVDGDAHAALQLTVGTDHVPLPVVEDYLYHDFPFFSCEKCTGNK